MFGQIGHICAIPTAPAGDTVNTHQLSFLGRIGPVNNALRRRIRDPFFHKKGHIAINNYAPISSALVLAHPVCQQTTFHSTASPALRAIFSILGMVSRASPE